MFGWFSSSTKVTEPRRIPSKYFAEFEASLPNLDGKVVVITGCTSGTGLVAAKTSAKKGASHVLMLNRPSDRAEEAEKIVKAAAVVAAAQGDDGTNSSNSSKVVVETIPCDLQDFDSVRSAVETIQSKHDSIDVLCNNAGVMALEDCATKDGYDVQMQTNHLSHFLLTKELFPLLEKASNLRGEARIVNHSSLARKSGSDLEARYFGKNGGDLGGNSSGILFTGPRWKRYGQTKLANSVFTAALRTKLEKTRNNTNKIKAVVAAPGLSATNLQVTTNQNGGMDTTMWIMRFAQSAEDGTMPLLSAMFDPTTENGDFWEARDYGNLSGPAVKVKYDSYTSNEVNAELLWKASEEACGKFDIE